VPEKSRNEQFVFNLAQVTSTDWNPLAAARKDFGGTILQQPDFGDLVEVDQVLPMAANQQCTFLKDFQGQFGHSLLACGNNLHPGRIGMDKFNFIQPNKEYPVSPDTGNLAQFLA
jgi:hypothetical protein